jgi:hypothetical protein
MPLERGMKGCDFGLIQNKSSFPFLYHLIPYLANLFIDKGDIAGGDIGSSNEGALNAPIAASEQGHDFQSNSISEM